MMPIYSSTDTQRIEDLMDRDAFPRIHDHANRSQLKLRLINQKRFLDLKSWGADIIYLQLCYQPLRELFAPDSDSIISACRRSYKGISGGFSEAYLRIWIYTMKHFPQLSKEPSSATKLDKGQRKLKPALANMQSISAVHEFASYAASLGFRVNSARSSFRVQDIRENPRLMKVELTSNQEHPERCGKPRQSQFEHDRKILSLSNLIVDFVPIAQGHPTSFAVTKSIFNCFWGYVIPQTAAQTSQPLNQRDSSNYSMRSDKPESISDILQYYRAPTPIDYSPVTLPPSPSDCTSLQVDCNREQDDDTDPDESELHLRAGNAQGANRHTLFPTSTDLGGSIFRGKVARIRRGRQTIFPDLAKRTSNDSWPWNLAQVQNAVQEKHQDQLLIVVIDSTTHEVVHVMKWLRTTHVERVKEDVESQARHGYRFVLRNSQRHTEMRPYLVEDIVSCWYALQTDNFGYAIMYRL